jgi:hypothetical protein
MAPTKSYSIEKRITRSVARIILNGKSDQTSSMFIETDNTGKEMKKEKVVPAANVFNSGMCISQDSVDFFHKLALYVSLVFYF